MEIHFEVQYKSGQRADHIGSVQNPSRFPCFVLNANNFDDYDFKTWFALFYFPEPNQVVSLGELKIMHGDDIDTYDVIDKSFDQLDNGYCSLGITAKYYKQLRDHFSIDDCKDILTALRDCGMDLTIYDDNKESIAFRNSLTRDLDSSRARREAKYIINNTSIEDAYKFEFIFHPWYNEDLDIPFRVNFDRLLNRQNSFYRCACVIGENGVGKTTMLSDLIECLINNEKDDFNGKIPLFSMVMSICTTRYDSFGSIQEPEDKRGKIPYYYFCAGQEKEDTTIEVVNSLWEIRKRTFQGEPVWDEYAAISRLLFGHIFDINEVLMKVESDDGFYYKINEGFVSDQIEAFSSGQLQLFLFITDIFEKLNYDSLLIIDEPEVHLHPRAITELFNILSHVLDFFQSYCIIATHSPIVVREIPGRNVYVMRRLTDEVCELGTIGFETLGEDISEINFRVFKYDESNTSFNNLVKKLARTKTYDEIISFLQNNGHPLSLNSRFQIKLITDYEKAKES